MTWTAPPKGSPADRVLDALGQQAELDWGRAARFCPGFDASAVERVGRAAFAGGDRRMERHRAVLGAETGIPVSEPAEAESASPPKERGAPRRVGRPRSEKGRLAYQLKAGGGRTWVSIAREVGLSDAGKGNVAKKAARRHAEREGLPWPVR